MVERILSGLVMIGVVFGVAIAGGPIFAAAVFIVFGIGLLEVVHLVARRGYRASGGLMLLWMALFVADRYWPDAGLFEPGTAFLLILTFAWSIIRYRQGTFNAITGFVLTVSMSFYIGWISAHLIGIRHLKDGMFWLMTVFFATASSDTMAYFLGGWFGRRPLIPDISPKKTWEGYLGGIISAILITGGVTYLWRFLGASDAVKPLHGMIIGGLTSIFGPLGDIGISMLKRYVGAKNASNLLPGHGGFLDRFDVLLVTSLMSYYYLTNFVTGY